MGPCTGMDLDEAADLAGETTPAPHPVPAPRFIRGRRAAEERERLVLAPYATFSAAAGPREHEEADDPLRTALERDRDRILHSQAFRALQHKTQVFVVHEGEHVRTRLTHTLEVAQIARALAGYLGANRDLAEAIALAHDLGHAPFGHAGEDELSRCMRALGLPAFDHNFASLRTVTELERRTPGFPGLNLTFATREGIARHETAYDRPAAVRAYWVTPQPSIEAQVANAADPLAYTTHDLEDALRLRFFDEEELLDLGLDVLKRAYDGAARATAALPAAERKHARARELHRRLIHELLTALLEEADRRLAALGPCPDAQALRRADAPVVGFPAPLGNEVDRLRGFLHRRVYKHPLVLDMCSKGQRILRALFEHYLERPTHLPERVQARFGTAIPTDHAARAPVVCDFVASLTDRGAMDLYRTLFDPYERALPWLGAVVGT